MSDSFVKVSLPVEVKRDKSELCVCPHCGNRCPMTILHQHSDVGFEVHENLYADHTCGMVYEMLECVSCSKFVLRRFDWYERHPYDPRGPFDNAKYEILYPVAYTSLAGIPKDIEKEYESANLVRSNQNAYAVLTGRVLDAVCIERNANGKTLNDKIEDLSKRGIVP